MSKHKNKIATRILNGKHIYFDSQKEARRFDELYLLLKADQISYLVLQPEFLLCEKQVHNGVTYPSVKYVADFKYVKDGATYVEDVKSEHTSKLAVYRVKIKWFLSLYGDKITFLET